MIKSTLFWIAAVVISLFLLAMTILPWQFEDIYQSPFLISKVAPVEHPGQLLRVKRFIGETPRPSDPVVYPIRIGATGPSQSLYAGWNQYPFFCMTDESGLGQPLVDNQDGYGVPVYPTAANGDIQSDNDPVGYSKDCMINTRIDYYYFDIEQEKFVPLTPLISMSKIKHIELAGNLEPFIVRLERGTINRFIYGLAMPVGSAGMKQARQGRTTEFTSGLWNQKLVYYFGGGSGIGFRQGKFNVRKFLDRQKDALAKGYALAASTGNVTSYTYNMLLAEDTASRVKKQFVARYGDPLYTVGLGGSGGAIQQYLIEQNNPDILDALIPQYSYPDMITQTIYALDCDLIEHYFAVRDAGNERWQSFNNRQAILGLSTSDEYSVPYPNLRALNLLMAGVAPTWQEGSSECVNGWFGLSSLVHNPKMPYLKPYYTAEVIDQVNWSYWQDMVQMFGEDNQGFGLSTWDNVGVQYGLSALTSGVIDVEEFIHLNQQIGSWVEQDDMQDEKLIWAFSKKLPVWLSMWGRHNIEDVEAGVAKRRAGSLKAIEQAYRYGQVFLGKVTDPVIDIRHYLDESLDMHHSSASLSARMRFYEQKQHWDNQLIWIAHKDVDITMLALQAIDEWMLAKQQGLQKPDSMQDSCFDQDGDVIADGPGVWDGEWNDKPPGACTGVYPFYKTSRIAAGDSFSGRIFKCQLQSVESAIESGIYGAVDMTPHKAQLEYIFPQGVCDYRQEDAGRPHDI